MTVSVSGEPITIDRDNYHLACDLYREKHNPHIPDHVALEQLSICPLPLLTPFSIEAWKLYQLTAGLSRISTPDEYYSQPAALIGAFNVITDELSKCQPKN